MLIRGLEAALNCDRLWVERRIHPFQPSLKDVLVNASLVQAIIPIMPMEISAAIEPAKGPVPIRVMELSFPVIANWLVIPGMS
jgi:hypothetical protein